MNGFFEDIVLDNYRGGNRYLNPLNDWHNHVGSDGVTMANMKLTDAEIEQMFDESLQVAGEDLYQRFHKSLEPEEDNVLRSLVIEYLTESAEDMDKYTEHIIDKAVQVLGYNKAQPSADNLDEVLGLAHVMDFLDFVKATRKAAKDIDSTNETEQRQEVKPDPVKGFKVDKPQVVISPESLREITQMGRLPETFGQMLTRQAGKVLDPISETTGKTLAGRVEKYLGNASLGDVTRDTQAGVRAGGQIAREGVNEAKGTVGSVFAGKPKGDTTPTTTGAHTAGAGVAAGSTETKAPVSPTTTTNAPSRPLGIDWNDKVKSTAGPRVGMQTAGGVAIPKSLQSGLLEEVFNKAFMDGSFGTSYVSHDYEEKSDSNAIIGRK